MGLLTGLRSSISRAISSLFAADEPKRIGIYGPPNAGKCLAPDETVLLADGTHRRIEDVFERVASTDPTDVSDDPDERWLACDGQVRVQALRSDLSVDAAPVSHVFRQRYDGPLYRVRTALGREVTVSPSHPFVAPSGERITTVRAEDLSVGDQVTLLSSFTPGVADEDTRTPASDGGATTRTPAADTPRGRDGRSHESEPVVPASVLAGDTETARSFLRALDEREDCTVEGDFGVESPASTDPTVTVASRSRAFLVEVSTLLLRFGLVGAITERADGARYVLSLADDCSGPHADIVRDEVVERERVHHEGYIYDLTVPDHHTFATAGGLVVHNTTLANRVVRDWTEHGDAVGPESHIPHETRRARRKEDISIERDGREVTIDVVDTPGVTTKVDYTEFLEHDMEEDDAVRRSREATEGVAEAMHWLREDVDGVIYVLDAAEDPFTQVNTMLIGIIESQDLPVLILANKIDLEEASVQRIRNAFPQHETIPLSALEGDNMDEVYDKIAEYFG